MRLKCLTFVVDGFENAAVNSRQVRKCYKLTVSYLVFDRDVFYFSNTLFLF